MSETLQLRGTLRGHNGWVTQIATNPKYPDSILSCSRGNYVGITGGVHMYFCFHVLCGLLILRHFMIY